MRLLQFPENKKTSSSGISTVFVSTTRVIFPHADKKLSWSDSD
jgi:hypothetical protein